MSSVITKKDFLTDREHLDRFVELLDDMYAEYGQLKETRLSFENVYPELLEPMSIEYKDLDFDFKKEYSKVCGLAIQARQNILISIQNQEWIKNRMADTETKVGNMVPAALLVSLLSRLASVIMVDVPDQKKPGVISKINSIRADLFREVPNLKALADGSNE